MKPFNLEEAKAGKKVVTRDGRNARIVSFNTVGDKFPITAIVESQEGESSMAYTTIGNYFSKNTEHRLDLFMADYEQEVSDLQRWCRELLPVVQAAANGEEIEHLDNDYWCAKDALCFNFDTKYRIKPKVKMVNGFEVPMHETSALSDNTTYYTPDIHNKAFNTLYWWGDSDDHRFLASGIVYLDKESATKCAKAMLGINPEGEE